MASSTHERLCREFPNLRTAPFQITSPASKQYNCIAWAAHDVEQWWWPDPNFQYYWPSNAPREETLTAFVQAYATIGFRPCPDGTPEAGHEKIALYTDQAGRPTHAAREASGNNWTSKLGDWEDIEHSLEGLENTAYGSVRCHLRRAAVE